MIDEPQLSTTARALMQAAKGDGPSAAAKAKIWGGVSGAAGAAGAAAAGPASSATSVGALGSGKLVAVGALFGSAITVGLAMVMMRVGPAPAPPADHANAAAQIAPRATADWEQIAPPFPAIAASARRPLDTGVTGSTADVPRPTLSAATAPAPPGIARATNAAPGNTPITVVREDALLRESMLVAEARGALVRGDAAGALISIRATQRLASRALEPEELSIESRAHRALSREDEAMAVDLRLRARFPEHALAR